MDYYFPGPVSARTNIGAIWFLQLHIKFLHLRLQDEVGKAEFTGVLRYFFFMYRFPSLGIFVNTKVRI